MKQIRSETGICHFRMRACDSLAEFLAHADLGELGLKPTLLLSEEWLRTGAVYIDGRRQLTDTPVHADQIVRLHTRPKRYSAARLGPWRERIVAESSDLLVFDKPSGLPTHATLDNFVENAKYVLEQELRIPLHTTHRLDIPTQGLLVFAKTRQAQAQVNRAFARGQVRKIYHAVSAVAVEPGAYTHHIDPHARVPRPIQVDARPGWWECRLEVEANGPLPGGAHWHRVRLLTGRTHQIRAQFTALGSPLSGDTLYGGAPGEFGLECHALELQLGANRLAFTRQRSFLPL